MNSGHTNISEPPMTVRLTSMVSLMQYNNNSVTVLPLSRSNTTLESDLPRLESSTTPQIRESSFGQTLGIRTKFQETAGSISGVGPPDLVHRAIYAGSKSGIARTCDFTLADSQEDKDNQDKYVGYYHYVNGIRFEKLEQDIERYICEILGIERDGTSYYFKPWAIDKLASSKREIVVTYCTYNIFNKSDLRARFVFQPSTGGGSGGSASAGSGSIVNGGSSGNSGKRLLVAMDSTFQIVPTNTDNQRTRKTISFNADTILELSKLYWEELRASHLIRLFHHTDNPDTQLAGLVNYTSFIESKEALISAVIILIKLLPKGSLSGVKSFYGTPTACGNKNDVVYKTNSYRNNLIDAILRLASLDLSGEVCDVAIRQIKLRYYFGQDHGEWDYVNLQLLKIQRGSNKEIEYLSLVNSSVKNNGVYTTQLGLILLDQVKFLITKQRYDMAADIAQQCILILPLDFDCWFYLALSYILLRDFEKAMLVINSFPISMNHNKPIMSVDTVEGGIKDVFTAIFLDRANAYDVDEEISFATFIDFFPPPKVPSSKVANGTNPRSKKSNGDIELASIRKEWHDSFLHYSHLRHPIVGHYFTQSPLLNSLAVEISSVETNLIKLCGPHSAKSVLASQSAGVPSCSMLDFARKSTWARAYDLLSLLVALVGWDQTVGIKETVFLSSKLRDDDGTNKHGYIVNHDSPQEKLVGCENWLEQMFVIIYEDLRALMMISGNNKSEQRSALEWEMIGLLGWSVKYNLRESISSLVTSVMGTNAEGGFDYFGTVQLLEIYDEFMLSDISDSCIDGYNDSYDGKFFSNKLILKVSSDDMFDRLIQSLEQEYLTLDFILLSMMKLVSWNIRWNQYAPNYLVTKILSTLIIKYDLVYLMTRFKIVFEQHKKHISKPSKFTTKLATLLTGGSDKPNKDDQRQPHFEFNDNDTIYQYMETLVSWIDNLKS